MEELKPISKQEYLDIIAENNAQCIKDMLGIPTKKEIDNFVAIVNSLLIKDETADTKDWKIQK